MTNEPGGYQLAGTEGLEGCKIHTEHDSRSAEKLEPRQPLRAHIVREDLHHVYIRQRVVSDAVSYTKGEHTHMREIRESYLENKGR